MDDRTPIQQLVTTEDTTTFSANLPGQESKASYDIVFRVTGDETKVPRVDWAHTRALDGRLRSILDEKARQINILAKVAKWQHRLLDYNSHYNAFLLEQLDEAEFEKIASEFAYEPTALSPDFIAPIISEVYALTGIYYTPSELADFFHCDHENVMEALNGLREKPSEILAMLPQTAE